MHRRFWTKSELSELRKRYPDETAQQIAEDLGRPVRGVYGKAGELGLSKSQAFIDSDRSGRIQRGRTDPRMIAAQFKPGHSSWNKGKKGFQPGGRSKETQFKSGRHASESRNYRPIGSLRITKDGILERKMTDDPSIYPARRWTPVARLVWETERGTIPPGHIVVFKPGLHTTIESEITVDRLECLSRAEHLQRHTYHDYPEPIARAIQLRGALNRRINRMEQEKSE